MIDLSKFLESAWDAETRQARCRIDTNNYGLEQQHSILENWVFKYFIYAYLTGDDKYVSKIISGLWVHDSIIPRVRYYGDKDMIKLDPNNGWKRGKDQWEKECWLRTDMGVGQATCILGLGLLNLNAFAVLLSTAIAKQKFQMMYQGEVVPQGKYLSMIPPYGNNILEALCISEIAKIPFPLVHRWRIPLSLRFVFPGESKAHRSIILWVLQKINLKYEAVFKAWIKTRPDDLVKAEEKAKRITDIYDPDFLSAQLDAEIQKGILEGILA